MAVTYLLVSVALLCLAAAFLIGYYVGRWKAQQGIYDCLRGYKVIRECE
jgi:hypothetical protein